MHKTNQLTHQQPRIIAWFTLILGINFFHEWNAPLQVTRKRLHQLQILLNIVDDHLAGVAIGRVQHRGAPFSQHRLTAAPVDNNSLLFTSAESWCLGAYINTGFYNKIPGENRSALGPDLQNKMEERRLKRGGWGWSPLKTPGWLYSIKFKDW